MPEDRRSGTRLLVGAAALFSLMSLQVKLAGRALPVEMLVVARAAVTLVLSYGAVKRRGIPIWGGARKLLVLRGVFGVCGLACFFTAVTRLPLAEVTVIHYLNPIFTAALAAVLLGERVDRFLVAAIVLGLGGTWLVRTPGVGAVALDPIGLWAALGGAAASACAYTTVRRLTRTEDPHVIVFYFPLVALPITLPFAVRAWVWPDWRGWLLLLGIGVTTQLAQVLLTRGLALVPAGRGTAVGYVQIVFAACWGALVFGEIPGWRTVLGAGLIVLGTGVVAFGGRRRISEDAPDPPSSPAAESAPE